ncbi:MAG: hypothetical protein MUO27_01625, partial [Sedimentisphaerales bacterium]|nr:hypothetical protein [Sedimentisphaerales bacterium]
QKEMIQEIESAKPELMVFVNVRTSWLTRNSSVMTIFNWFDRYAENFYNIVGVIEIFPSGQTVYRWDQQAASYTPRQAAGSPCISENTETRLPKPALDRPMPGFALPRIT